MSPLIECVPNVSEGRNREVLDSLATSIGDAGLLDRSSDPDHHRSVFTFAGPPEAVLEAALHLAETAFQRLSIIHHKGVHPRIGVLDVLPFVPVRDATLADCAALAHRAAAAIWQRFAVPSFFYEAAGTRALEDVRRLAAAGAPPDIGAGRHPTAGAVAIGARPFLIAWNIWLATQDLALAKQIARRIRGSSGGFSGVKALGLPLASRNLVQVSINTADFGATPLHLVFQTVAQLAQHSGVAVLGSELIGLIPERAVELSRGHDLRWLHWDDTMIFERRYSKGSVSNPCA